jgi:hypothetical protein
MSFDSYILERNEIEYILRHIGSDNTMFENIYNAVIQNYTKCQKYISSRYNIGTSSVPTIGNLEVSTIRYHTDINSSGNTNFTTALVYLDDAKLDYKDTNEIEQTLDIYAGTLVIFNSNTFIHRTNPYGKKTRRLLQYFLCHDEPTHQIHYMCERDNKLIYKLHEISRQYDLYFPESVKLQHFIADQIIDNVLIATTNIGNLHGEHSVNSKAVCTICMKYGITFIRFE